MRDRHSRASLSFSLTKPNGRQRHLPQRSKSLPTKGECVLARVTSLAIDFCPPGESVSLTFCSLVADAGNLNVHIRGQGYNRFRGVLLGINLREDLVFGQTFLLRGAVCLSLCVGVVLVLAAGTVQLCKVVLVGPLFGVNLRVLVCHLVNFSFGQSNGFGLSGIS